MKSAPVNRSRAFVVTLPSIQSSYSTFTQTREWIHRDPEILADPGVRVTLLRRVPPISSHAA